MINKQIEPSVVELASWIDKVNIEELIPHSPPMVLIERIVSVGEQQLTAEITITPQSRFFDSKLQAVPTWVGIEYMAQTIAALAGLRAKASGRAIKLGFLLGTRKFSMPINSMPAGKTYQISVEQLYMDDTGLANFDCQINCGEQTFASAKLNVFETDNVQKIIEK